MAAAIDIERRMGKTKMALKDILSRVIADFNKMVSIKRHRIDGVKKALLYNMSLGIILLA